MTRFPEDPTDWEIFDDQPIRPQAPTTFACRRNQAVRSDPFIKITPYQGSYLVKFPYNDDAIRMLKIKIPVQHRNYLKEQRAWVIHPDSIEAMCQTLEEVFHGRIVRPEPITAEANEETRILRVEYLGACRSRGDQSSAYGSIDGDWSVEFPEDVLKRYFGGVVELNNTEHLTLYQVLLVGESATDQEIKSGYRRMALQWHPDRCKEDNATEKFREINEAYQILSNPTQRKKYDVGLYFERQATSTEPFSSRDLFHRRYKPNYGYRSPLRCGEVTVKGIDQVGRFRVSEILAWKDLINEQGQTAVSSWPTGAKTFSIMWV